MQTIRTIDNLYYREIGKQIRKVREHRNMTLKELSQATGYSRPLIDHWELGLSKIKPKQYENICKALNISTSIKVEVTLGYLDV